MHEEQREEGLKTRLFALADENEKLAVVLSDQDREQVALHIDLLKPGNHVEPIPDRPGHFRIVNAVGDITMGYATVVSPSYPKGLVRAVSGFRVAPLSEEL